MAKTSMAGSGWESLGKFLRTAAVREGGVVGVMGETSWYRETPGLESDPPPDDIRVFSFWPASYITGEHIFSRMRSYLVISAFVLLCLSGSVAGQTPSPAMRVPEGLSSDDVATMNTLLNPVLSSEDAAP